MYKIYTIALLLGALTAYGMGEQPVATCYLSSQFFDVYGCSDGRVIIADRCDGSIRSLPISESSSIDGVFFNGDHNLVVSYADREVMIAPSNKNYPDCIISDTPSEGAGAPLTQ